MNSGLSSMHPAVIFAYYTGVLLFGMLLFHPVFLLGGIACHLLIILLHGLGRHLLKLLPFYLLAGGSVAIINPLLSHRGRHILFYFMDQPVTLEAVLYGATMMLSVLTILLAFVSYRAIMTPDKFMYLFASVAPKTSLLAVMATRFVPLLMRRLSQLTLVQRTRGIDVKSGPYRKRMRDGMLLLRVLLAWSLEDAMQTADSMKARGYGTGPRSTYVVYRMDRRDWTVLGCMLFMAALLVASWLQGYGTLQIYPRLEPIVPGAAEAAACVVYGLFLLIPACLELKERWTWRSSASNI